MRARNGKFLAAIALLCVGLAGPARAAQEIDFGRYHALVIGINDYKNLPRLETAVNDASAVADLLRQKYGFAVTLLLNPGRSEVIRALDRLRGELTERDNLLIYYAGHGVLDVEADIGFWMSVDAERDTQADWISIGTITGTVRAMSARHVMIVSDSCYSGRLTRGFSVSVKTGSERVAELRRLAGKRSRTALVSGGLEPVADGGGDGHSVFTRAFLTALRESREILDGQQLFTAVRRPVIVNADQTPEYSDIRLAGHDGGDFLFVPMSLGAIAAAPDADQAGGSLDLQVWREIKDSTDPADFETFVESFPSSPMAPFARNRVKALSGVETALTAPPELETPPAAEPAVGLFPVLPIVPATAGSRAEIVLNGIVGWLTRFARDNPGAPRLVVAAPVRAVQSGAEVIVTFPGVELVWNDGSRIHVGDVDIPITPRESGLYDFKVRLSERFELRDAAGATTQAMTLGDSTISGSWTAAEALPSGLSATLRGIEVVSADAAGRVSAVISIAALDARHALGPDPSGGWRGTFESELSGMRFRGEAGSGGQLSLQRMGATLRYDRVRAADWYEFLGTGRAASEADAPAGVAEVATAFDFSGLEFSEGAVGTASFREASFRLDLAREDGGRWDVLAELDFSDLAASGFDDGADIAIGEIGLSSQTRDYPLAQWRELAERFGLDLSAGAVLSEPHKRELADAVRAVRWGTSASELGLSRVAVGPPAAPLFTLESASFRFAFDGREALVSGGYGLAATGLYVANPDVPAQLLAREAVIEVSFEDLPPEALILPTLVALEGQGGSDAVPGVMLVEVLNGLTGEMPPAIVLDAFGYDAEVIGVFGSGRISADPASPGGFRGDFDVSLRDLGKFEAFVAAAEGEGAAWAQGPVGAACVAALRETGATAPPDSESAGPVHNYVISVTADGNAIVNGVPFAALVERCAAPGSTSPN